MASVVLSAFLSAVVVILDGHPNREQIVVVCVVALVVWTVLLALPAVVRSHR